MGWPAVIVQRRLCHGVGTPWYEVPRPSLMERLDFRSIQYRRPSLNHTKSDATLPWQQLHIPPGPSLRPHQQSGCDVNQQHKHSPFGLVELSVYGIWIDVASASMLRQTGVLYIGSGRILLDTLPSVFELHDADLLPCLLSSRNER